MIGDFAPLISSSARFTTASCAFGRDAAVDVRHAGRALLVACQDERDLVARCKRRVQGECLLAGNAEDVTDALVLEALHEELRDVQRAASPMSRSTMTVSRHAPSSLACRRYVPTSRNPTFARSLRLASFSGKTRETSFQMPRPSHSRTSASIAARPAPVPRASRATDTENSATPA